MIFFVLSCCGSNAILTVGSSTGEARVSGLSVVSCCVVSVGAVDIICTDILCRFGASWDIVS